MRSLVLILHVFEEGTLRCLQVSTQITEVNEDDFLSVNRQMLVYVCVSW